MSKKIAFIDHIQRKQYPEDISLVMHPDATVFDLEEFAQRFNDDHEKIGRIQIISEQEADTMRNIENLKNQLKLQLDI